MRAILQDIEDEDDDEGNSMKKRDEWQFSSLNMNFPLGELKFLNAHLLSWPGVSINSKTFYKKSFKHFDK